MRILILAIISSLILASCATIPSKKLSPENFKLNDNEGAIAGVIAMLKKTSSSHSNIFYTNDEISELISEKKSNQFKFVLQIGTAAPKLMADFEKSEDDKYVYFFFVVKEKPGNYKFYEYTFFFNSGYIQEVVAYAIDQDIEFNIEKGKIKYFGTIFLNSKNRQLFYTDRFKKEDLQKFKEKLPHITITE